MTNDQVFRLWDGWLDKIYSEVLGLLILRHVFWEVQKIIEANPRIQKPSSFYKWMGATYSAAAPLGIRRQLDERPDSVSFARLFVEITKCPHVLTRARYVALWNQGSDPRSLADQEFDRFAGKGNPYVDRSLVQSDLERLRAEAAAVKGYVNKAVAHIDQTGPSTVPSFNDLDACLDLFEELVKKYFLLFRAVGLVSVLPTWQYDWKAIFREPWIPPVAR